MDESQREARRPGQQLWARCPHLRPLRAGAAGAKENRKTLGLFIISPFLLTWDMIY
ncbi:hypothetical protein HMPREF0239_00341 [Clostridium sp. ATCC BAA-442]|nr:hypothetical protein HMPREF0239_00341 [Clostridium sp. ATCC BAA-442]